MAFLLFSVSENRISKPLHRTRLLFTSSCIPEEARTSGVLGKWRWRGCSNQDQLWLGLEVCQNAGRKQNNALQQSTDNELICASSGKRNLISSMWKGTFADCSHLCLECNKRPRKRTSRSRSEKKSLFVILFRICVSKVEACEERHQDMTSVWIEKSYYEEDVDSR